VLLRLLFWPPNKQASAIKPCLALPTANIVVEVEGEGEERGIVVFRKKLNMICLLWDSVKSHQLLFILNYYIYPYSCSTPTVQQLNYMII
jgi:hypothetical protein